MQTFDFCRDENRKKDGEERIKMQKRKMTKEYENENGGTRTIEKIISLDNFYYLSINFKLTTMISL